MKPYYEHGGITIYHGDCREVLLGLSFRSVVTDPPYGIEFTSGKAAELSNVPIVGDEDTSIRDSAIGLAGDVPMLVFGSWRSPRPASTRALLVWDKGEHVGMGDLKIPWKPNTEEVYVIGRGFLKARRAGSVLRYRAVAGCVGARNDGKRYHPTEKPLELMHDLVRVMPETILDPFMGSGTTLRAAKDLGRKAIGIEIEEKYCEIAANRLRQEVLF